MPTQDLTSLGGHRLPIRRVTVFDHSSNNAVVLEDSVTWVGYLDFQDASQVTGSAVAEVATAVAVQTASLAGEVLHPEFTDLGGHRLPVRRYESFPHGVTNTGAVAESTTAVDAPSVTSVLGIAVAESLNAVDTVATQSSLPGAVDEAFTPLDTIDAALTRVGALVSMQGPMGMPRQRYVDFIHPASVDEVANFTDIHDAARPGAVVGFVGETLALVDTQNVGGTFSDRVEDDLDLNDTSATGAVIYTDAVAEAAGALVDTTDAQVLGKDVTVSEVGVLVDISLITANILQAVVGDALNLHEVNGIAGELYDEVNETVVMRDFYGSFIPGVTLDGTRTIHVVAETRELEVV